MTGDTTDGALPDDTEIGRVALRVADLDACLAFYRDVVGLSVRSRDDDHATLGAGDRALLELTADPDAPARGRSETGLFHTAFLVPSRQALADALARIERQAELDGASDHLVSEALYLSDPEGNGIEIYRDRDREAWPRTETGVEMATRPLNLDALRSAATSTDRAPPATTVGHVHLEVSSIERARKFYVDVLGFEPMQTYGESALFVAAGGYHHHVGLNVWNGRTDPPSGRGLDRFAIRVPRAAFETFRSRLERADIATESRDDGVTITDPNGITVRIERA